MASKGTHGTRDVSEHLLAIGDDTQRAQPWPELEKAHKTLERAYENAS